MWILLLIFVFFIIYCFLQRNAHELFFRNRLSVNFLNKKEGCKVLTNPYDSYIENMKPQEMKYKNCTTSSTNIFLFDECKTTYCDSVLEWTPNEKKAILWVISSLSSFLQSHYPKFNSTRWTLLKLSNKIEKGLPHTRLDVIVLPEDSVTRLLKIYKKKEKNSTGPLRSETPLRGALKDMGKILLHEQFHIFFKNSSTLHPFYEEVWNFRKVDFVPESQYLNPDTLTSKWILQSPVESNTFCLHTLDHPDEIAANFWSEIILDGMHVIHLSLFKKKCLQDFRNYVTVSLN